MDRFECRERLKKKLDDAKNGVVRVERLEGGRDKNGNSYTYCRVLLLEPLGGAFPTVEITGLTSLVQGAFDLRWNKKRAAVRVVDSDPVRATILGLVRLVERQELRYSDSKHSGTMTLDTSYYKNGIVSTDLM